MFAPVTYLFVVFWKFHSYSTDLHTWAKNPGKKTSQEIVPFSRKTYSVQNWYKSGFVENLKSYPLAM